MTGESPALPSAEARRRKRAARGKLALAVDRLIARPDEPDPEEILRLPLGPDERERFLREISEDATRGEPPGIQGLEVLTEPAHWRAVLRRLEARTSGRGRIFFVGNGMRPIERALKCGAPGRRWIRRSVWLRVSRALLYGASSRRAFRNYLRSSGIVPGARGPFFLVDSMGRRKSEHSLTVLRRRAIDLLVEDGLPRARAMRKVIAVGIPEKKESPLGEGSLARATRGESAVLRLNLPKGLVLCAYNLPRWSWPRSKFTRLGARGVPEPGGADPLPRALRGARTADSRRSPRMLRRNRRRFLLLYRILYEAWTSARFRKAVASAPGRGRGR